MISLSGTIREEQPDIPTTDFDVEFDDCGASPVRITRENTRLYTFWGKYAICDHVFVVCLAQHFTPDNDDDAPMPENPATGHYIFSFEKDFPAISDMIRRRNFKQALNEEVPDPGDIAAYERASSLHILNVEQGLHIVLDDQDPTEQG
jgi:hypothetical protein